jgi:hypothetical protein
MKPKQPKDDPAVKRKVTRVLLNRPLEMKVNPRGLVSLLMTEYLIREESDPQSRLKGWLNAVNRVQTRDWAMWLELTSRVVLKTITRDFRRTLERGLSESERHFLARNVRELVEIYGKSRSKVEVFNQKGDSSC